jgi:amidase
VNPAINAVVRVLEKEALAAADTADAAQARGDAPGPLHGVPVTVKVNTDQAGCPTDNGVVAFRDAIATEDSPAAIATGIGPIAHGNDIGGSVRIPALFNGAVGLRVSLGRIPSYNPSQQVARPIGAQLMAVQGPLTRSVHDARLALAVMSHGDPCDTRWWADVPLEAPPLPRPIRVALVPENPGGSTHPAQAEAVRQAGRHLATAGYAVEEVTPPDLNEIIETWHRICSTDVLGALAPRVEEFGDADARTSMRLWLELFPPTDIQGILAAFAQRDLLLWRWLAFTRRYPLVVMPTMGDLAPPHNLDTTKEGQVRVADSIRVSLISPLLGVPALAVPVGSHGRLRPGVQILAPRFREDLCLDAGEVVEAAEGVVVPIDPVQ